MFAAVTFGIIKLVSYLVTLKHLMLISTENVDYIFFHLVFNFCEKLNTIIMFLLQMKYVEFLYLGSGKATNCKD